MRKRSILLRAALVQVAVFALILAAINYFGIRQALRERTGVFDTLQTTVAQGAAAMAESNLVHPELLQSDAKLIEDTYRKSNRWPDTGATPFVPLIEIWAADGRLLYRTAGEAPFQAVPASGHFSEIVHRGGTWRLYTASGPQDKIRFVLAESLDWRRACVVPKWHEIAINLLILFALFWLTSWVALRAGLRPLRTLAAELSQRRPQALQPVHTGLDYKETYPLVAALNGMMARVTGSLQREQAFLADAAHELRTPIAAIQVQLYGLLNARSTEEREEIGRDIQQGLDRASSLAHQLIALARVQSEGFVMSRKRVDLVEVASDCIAAYVPLARTRTQTISLAYCGGDHAWVDADPAALASVVDNLLDNAIKYGSVGGQIEVDLRIERSQIVLSVRDDGPGVPPEHRERLFERFYRVPDTTASGSGLGLAIVRSLVERHGGTVALCDGLGGKGIGFVVTLAAS